MSVTHGLASTYRSAARGCRCEPCRKAHAERHRRENESRAERLRADPSLQQHGTWATYSNWGCRCETCGAEARRVNAARRRRRLFGGAA